ncbi:MAG: glycosyltransferase family 2 protein [Saprospiraceae bacterium]
MLQQVDSPISKLSVVIITFNEERNIAACIASVASIADEIVVVDSFSTDQTQEICERSGVRFVQHVFEGYGAQKNFANAQARYDLVLNLDADERPDQTLISAIQRVKKQQEADIYTFNRCNNYCGKWIRHGAWYPDVKMRLYDRRKGNWTNAIVHETFSPDTSAKIQHLPGNLLHYSYQNIDEHRRQLEKYSTLGAKESFDKGKKSTWVKQSLNPSWRFFRDYILRLGLLDGTPGWTIARLTAQEVYLKYSKLRELNKKKA